MDNSAYDLVIKIITNEIEKNNKNPAFYPIIFGIQGPQGCGKSTVCHKIVSHYKNNSSFNVVLLSLDNFYYPFCKQPFSKTNWLLSGRSNPGTHDVNLLYEKLLQLKQWNDASSQMENMEGNDSCVFPKGRDISLPVFDKYIKNGQGDRSGFKNEYIPIPLHLVILEGWCLGFEAVPLNELEEVVPKLTPCLQEINTNLECYDKINQLLDVLIIFSIDDLEWIYMWRQEQESTSRSTFTLPDQICLSREEVDLLIDRCMPSYKFYYKNLLKDAEEHDRKYKTFVIRLDKNRNVVFCQNTE